MNVHTHSIRGLAALFVATAITPGARAAEPPAPVGTVAGHVHVYILDGFDPIGASGVTQLGEQLRNAGLPATQVGGWYRAWAFEREIRALHAADPTARFALIGYSAGTYAARAAANRLIRDGVPVAVVGYIGGDYLRDTEETRVVGARQVVNVTGDGYLLTGRNLLFNGTDVTGARNVRLVGTRHYSLPTHPDTFAKLYSALTASP